MNEQLINLRIDGYRDKNTGSTSLNRPKVCGYFSINGEREYLADTSQLKYLIEPPTKKISFDLKIGYESVKRKSVDPADGKINNLLKWILQNSEKIKASPGSNQWLNVDFVCFRGRLLKLFATPYEKREGWIISACKWRGTIYLCEFYTEKKKNDKKKLPDKIRQILSWGFKFEQYMLSDAPGKKPNTLEPVDETEEFCCIFESRLGNHKLLYGSEMDGVRLDEKLEEPIDFNRVEFVELKSSRKIANKYQDIAFKKNKLLKWWSQCYLVGIDDVLCGFRTDDGVVEKLEYFKVDEMPDKSKNFWTPNRCLNFCDDFLNAVKLTVEKDYDECVYKFVWEPGEKVRVEEVDPGSEYDILPEWFINEAEPYDNTGQKSEYKSKQNKKRKSDFRPNTF